MNNSVLSRLRLFSFGLSRKTPEARHARRFHRMQEAMEGIAEAIDPLVTAPTAEQDRTTDEAHARGHTHLASPPEPLPPDPSPVPKPFAKNQHGTRHPGMR